MNGLFGLQSSVRFVVLTRPQVDDVLEGRVTLGALKVYLALYARADFRTWECFPGYEKMAEDAGVSRSTVVKAVSALSDRGWVVRLKGRTAAGRQASNRYHLSHPASWLAGQQVQIAVSGDLGPHQRVTDDPAQRVTDDPLTSTHLKADQKTGAAPLGPSPQTADWNALFESYEGRKTSEARGRYFSLSKARGWSAAEIAKRLAFFVTVYRALGWNLPQLAHVLDPAKEQLDEGNLDGLDMEAKQPKRRP